MKYVRKKSIQYSTNIPLFVIWILGPNFCRKFRPTMTTTPSLRCSLKNLKCLCTLLWKRKRKFLSWGNGMSMEFWGKPRNSQNKVFRRLSSTNDCIRQHICYQIRLQTSLHGFPFSICCPLFAYFYYLRFLRLEVEAFKLYIATISDDVLLGPGVNPLEGSPK
jgi:hypothetical protein